MGFTDLLDQLSAIGPTLAASAADDGDSEITDATNEVNAALLPVWQWLDGLKAAADRSDIEWVKLDGAPSDDSIASVMAAIESLSKAVSDGDVPTLQSELPLLGSLLLTVAEETDERLAESGADAEQRNRLLLPLHAHVSELAVARGSSEALSLARKSLGQVGEKQLSEGIATKVKYEQRRADWFRVAAVLAFLVSIGWLIGSYWAFGSPEITSESDRITQVVARLAIASAVFALAVYLSSEANAHRERASGWQSVQLQMDTLELYCASLPVEHRNTIRLSFGLEVFSGSRLFGSFRHGSSDGKRNGAVVSPFDTSQVLALVKAVNGAGKS
ncbi:MAG: hypothetical protein ABW196_02440 [Solirubrobacterales bacterium]